MQFHFVGIRIANVPEEPLQTLYGACENELAPLSCLRSKSNQNIVSLPGQQKREKQGPKPETFC